MLLERQSALHNNCGWRLSSGCDAVDGVIVMTVIVTAVVVLGCPPLPVPIVPVQWLLPPASWVGWWTW